ncbi:unnamed protein product, partial [Symbiodinium sp. KB8]
WISIKLKDKVLAVRKDPTPVLLAFYSGGMKPAQGPSWKPLLQRASPSRSSSTMRRKSRSGPCSAEFKPDACTRKCSKWDEYLDELQKQVEAPEFHSRSVVIFAHSHGCLAAYGLAKRLGKRLVKLYVAARRPPNLALLDEVWGVLSGSAVAALSDQALLEGLLDSWRNTFLAPLRGKADLPPVAKKVCATVREQYATPCAPGGSADLAVALGSDSEAKVAAPIMAIACSKELEKGETAAKMEGWQSLAGADFELRTVNADHMDCLTPDENGKTPELITLVVEDMKKLRSSDSG